MAGVAYRSAEREDLESINRIYNHYVVGSHYTFDLEPTSMAWREEWFCHYGREGRWRAFVAVAGDEVIGYSTSGRFRPKPAYETSVETSIYLDADAIGRGVGGRLYTTLFAALEGQDVHRAYAGIALPNPTSIALHERLGFKQVALFTQQGRKFDRYWDVAWYEKPLNGG